MNKKLFFLLLCGGIFFQLSAQRIEVGEPQLVREAGTEAFHPRFTPDGTTILLTSASYSGLRAINLETRQLREITRLHRAGWNPVISADSRTVYFQTEDLTERGIRNARFYSHNLETRQTRQVTAFSNEAAQSSENTLRSRSTAQTPTVVFVNQDLQIVVERNGVQRTLTPLGTDVQYIWASLSPDGTRISFYSMATGEVFISDLDGNVLANLGALDAPVWLNNDWVVGMNEVNDGRNITAANIVAVTSNGRVRQNLTQLDQRIAMFPAASPDGRRIAFHTLEGNLYLMEVSIHD